MPTSPKRRPKRRKVVTTVNLEPAVRSYLDLLMARHDRDRSYVVNTLVRRLMQEEGLCDAAHFPPLMKDS